MAVLVSDGVRAKYKCQWFHQFKNVSALSSGGRRARSLGVAQSPTAVRNADGCDRSRYFAEQASGPLGS